jgi:hypothetical protein
MVCGRNLIAKGIDRPRPTVKAAYQFKKISCYSFLKEYLNQTNLQNS